MNENQTLKSQLPLYRADLFRAQKSALQLKIEDIVDRSKEIGESLAYGTVQQILKGESKNPQLQSLWAISKVLGVPFKSVFDIDHQGAN